MKGLFRFRQPYVLLTTYLNPLIFVDSNPWITVTLAMIGKFQIAASFAVIYVYAGELMPTVVRSEAMGISSFVAGIGLLLFPYINALVRKKLKKKNVLVGFKFFFLNLSGTLQSCPSIGYHGNSFSFGRHRSSVFTRNPLEAFTQHFGGR